MDNAKTEAINPSGEAPTGIVPLTANADTLAAGNAALEQHLAESTKRRRGAPIKHGKYVGQKRARKIPMAAVGNGSVQVLLPEVDHPADVEIGTEAVEEPFDEASNREYAGLIVNGLALLNNALKRWKIVRATENPDLADWVIAKKTIGEKPREALEGGLVLCAKKHGIDLAKTPEGMVILGLLVWQAEDA